MTESHDFLIVDHGRVGFLINREQFYASVYLNETGPLQAETPPAYCAGTLLFRDQRVLVYELDRKLGDLFSSPPPEGLKIALIADTAGFSPRLRRRFEEIAGAADSGISLKTVAFRIGSRAEIKRLLLRELAPVPGRLKHPLRARGVFGCRFETEGGIHFFVDIETITFGSTEST